MATFSMNIVTQTSPLRHSLHQSYHNSSNSLGYRFRRANTRCVSARLAWKANCHCAKTPTERPTQLFGSRRYKPHSVTYRLSHSREMHAITRVGSAEEPLTDRSRVEEPIDQLTQRRTALPDDLDEVFPDAQWTRAIYDEKKRRFPQTIAHRGYRASFPENTMIAFRGAVEAGTHAIETDVHLSKDGVVVLSHDKDLKRCFGTPEKIIDCDWQFLSQQKTSKEPHEPMPRLSDLLEYLGQPEQQHIWVLLDIKVDNDANDVMRLIAATLKSVDSGSRKWSQRVVLGIWAARYLPLCVQYLPGFSVSHIGFSTYYSRQFLKVPNVSFNTLQKVVFGPIGTSFMRDIKKANRPLYFWTVNDNNLMRWSIQREVDGVITDDPRVFKKICNDWTDDEPVSKITWSQTLYTIWIYVLISVFWIPFKRRFPESVDTFLRGSKPKSAPKINQ